MKHDKNLQAALMKIGDGLAKFRKRKGFDQMKAFCTKYKVPLIHYWRLEHGKTNITLRSLKRVLDIHKMEIVQFFIYISRL